MRNWNNEGLGYLNFPIAAFLLSILCVVNTLNDEPQVLCSK